MSGDASTSQRETIPFSPMLILLTLDWTCFGGYILLQKFSKLVIHEILWSDHAPVFIMIGEAHTENQS